MVPSCSVNVARDARVESAPAAAAAAGGVSCVGFIVSAGAYNTIFLK